MAATGQNAALHESGIGPLPPKIAGTTCPQLAKADAAFPSRSAGQPTETCRGRSRPCRDRAILTVLLVNPCAQRRVIGTREELSWPTNVPDRGQRRKSRPQNSNEPPLLASARCEAPYRVSREYSSVVRTPSIARWEAWIRGFWLPGDGVPGLLSTANSFPCSMACKGFVTTTSRALQREPESSYLSGRASSTFGPASRCKFVSR